MNYASAVVHAATSTATYKEILVARAFWVAQQNIAKEMCLTHRITPEALEVLSHYVAPNNFGYDFGQLRPGRDGQFDLYGSAKEWGITDSERLLISGLSRKDVRHYGDNSVEFVNRRVALGDMSPPTWEELERMSEADLVAFIAREELLYKSKPF